MSTPATVYRMYDAEGVCLYIGCAGVPPCRLQRHRGTQPWYRQVARIEMEHFDSRTSAFMAEAAAIRKELPVHNVQHKPNGDPAEVAA